MFLNKYCRLALLLDGGDQVTIECKRYSVDFCNVSNGVKVGQVKVEKGLFADAYRLTYNGTLTDFICSRALNICNIDRDTRHGALNEAQPNPVLENYWVLWKYIKT